MKNFGLRKTSARFHSRTPLPGTNSRSPSVRAKDFVPGRDLVGRVCTEFLEALFHFDMAVALCKCLQMPSFQCFRCRVSHLQHSFTTVSCDTQSTGIHAIVEYLKHVDSALRIGTD
jgi:hypothetical protein